MLRNQLDNGSSSTTNGKVSNNRNAPDNVDSTEVDPCIDQTDFKPPLRQNQPFYEKYLSNIQSQSGLSRKWVLLVIGLVALVSVLILVIIGLSIGWPRSSHMFRYPICRSPECLQVASQLQRNLDTSLSPCDNLWGSVCAQYANKSVRPTDRPVWDQKQELIQKELERTRDLISTLELPLHIGTPEWKLKQFYDSCLNADAAGGDHETPLTNIISELGGWYVLREWAEQDFNGMELLKKLHVRYGVSPYFRIHVEPNPHVPNSYSIRISPSGLGLPDKEFYNRDASDQVITSYVDYIRDTVMSLSTPKTRAEKFAKDMFNYEKRLAEITPDSVILRNPITTYNAISAAELKLTTPIIPFYDILQAMYLEANVTEVVVTSLEYLGQLSQIISTTDRRTMNGYLIWSLVRDYVPFMTETYRSPKEAFNNDFFGTTQKRKRWQICSSLTRKHMSLAVEYHLERSFPINDATRRTIYNVFRHILTAVTKQIAHFDGTMLLKQHLESKLATLTLNIGIPENAKSEQFLRDYYNSLRILKMDFFENMKNSLSFQKKTEQTLLLNSLPQGIILPEALAEYPKVRYVPSRNVLVVPRSLVMEPFFDAQYPKPINYGRLGVEIASAILSSVLPYDSLWKADWKILSTFHMTVNESLRSVEKEVECLLKFMPEAKLEAARGKETALNLLKELSATRLAFDALLADSNPAYHSHFGGLEPYEDSALFFLTYAQTHCSESTKEYELHENLMNFHLPSRTVLNLAWMQLEDFRRAFDCEKSTGTTCLKDL